MKKHLFSKVLPFALAMAFLLMVPYGGNVRAQGMLRAPSLVGVRVSGGISWDFGGSFAGENANGMTVVQPEAGIGVTLAVAPRFRAGVGYDYTRMVREQVNGTLQPMSGNVLPGSVEGTVYRDFKTHFHAVALTAEYNLLPTGGFLSLYVGTGAGCLFATGNSWSLSIRNEMRSNDWTNTVTVDGHNEAHHYTAPFIPASLSLECRILPGTSLCLSGVYRQILSKNELAPKGQATASLGLRLAF